MQKIFLWKCRDEQFKKIASIFHYVHVNIKNIFIVVEFTNHCLTFIR